ncbi:MAG TPA: SWIB/MDM2 domain-containing protein [Gemmatimonadaceae bacterium]|nr:SWIB/MDM2 domain-containing protein [Gemmatimonadaceae bacterium]
MATKKRGGAKKKGSAKKKSGRKAAKRPARKKGAAKRASKGAARRKAGKKTRKAARKKRAPNPAFMRPMQPDASLAAVVGDRPMPRTEITKRLWTYIKKNGLQDKKERRMINADDKLRAVFNGKRQVSMFEMTRLVNAHMKA